MLHQKPRAYPLPDNINAIQTIATTPSEKMGPIGDELNLRAKLHSGKRHRNISDTASLPPLTPQEEVLRATIKDYDRRVVRTRMGRRIAEAALLGAAFAVAYGAVEFDEATKRGALPDRPPVAGQLFPGNSLVLDTVPLGDTGVSIPHLTYHRVPEVNDTTGTDTPIGEIARSPYGRFALGAVPILMSGGFSGAIHDRARLRQKKAKKDLHRLNDS